MPAVNKAVTPTINQGKYMTQRINLRLPCSTANPEPNAVDALGIAPNDFGKVVMLSNYPERDVYGANSFGTISL